MLLLFLIDAETLLWATQASVTVPFHVIFHSSAQQVTSKNDVFFSVGNTAYLRLATDFGLVYV